MNMVSPLHKNFSAESNRSLEASPVSNRTADPWRIWPVTVKRLIGEAPHVFTVELAFDDATAGDTYDFAPGQFNMLYVPGVGEAAISVAGKSSRGGLLHTIRAVGSVTQTLEKAATGFPLGLRGPFGRSWPTELLTRTTPPADLIVVAGGIGIAPLRALIEEIVQQRASYGHVSVLIGARTSSDLLYRYVHDQWQEAGIDVQSTIDRADGHWRGQVGVVTLLIDRLEIAHPASTIVMTCGPEVMMRYVAKSALSRGIPSENIWVTLERNMNCAIGLCGHCQLGPAFICKDGPVFPYNRVSQWLNVPDL